MPPTYIQFYDSVETVVRYASRYGTANIVLSDIKLGDFFTAVTIAVGDGPIIEEAPITFDQCATALETIAAYCQDQKLPETQVTGLVLGNGVTVTLTTQWAVAGAYDQTSIVLTATRIVAEIIVTVAISGGTFKKSNIVD